jgi:hypothetical protein
VKRRLSSPLTRRFAAPSPFRRGIRSKHFSIIQPQIDSHYSEKSIASGRGIFGAVVTFEWLRAHASTRALVECVTDCDVCCVTQVPVDDEKTIPPFTFRTTSRPCRIPSRRTGFLDHFSSGSNGTRTTVTPLCPSISSATNRTLFIPPSILGAFDIVLVCCNAGGEIRLTARTCIQIRSGA